MLSMYKISKPQIVGIRITILETIEEKLGKSSEKIVSKECKNNSYKILKFS